VRVHFRATILIVIAWAAPVLSAPAESPDELLEAAIYRAKVLGDLPGAIQQFESIATRYAGKPVAAQALLEMAHAEELLGHKRRAHAAYRRIMDDYPDQIQLVANAKQNPESIAGLKLRAKGTSWVDAHRSNAPSARCCMGLTYDAGAHSTLLFGGFTPYVCFGDTWVWRNGWHQLSPAASPSARTGPGLAYDAAAGNVLLFGGVDSAGKPLNDTWIWDGNTWTQQFPPVSPPARQFDAEGMAYHPGIRKVVLFGGAAGGQALGDTWTWDGLAKAWTRQSPASSPSPRRTSLVYDEANRTVVLFGGHLGGAPRNDRFFDDTWTWDGISWTQRFPASSPSARGMISLAYDAALDSVVLFGGLGKPGGPSNETWLWNGSDWSQIHPSNAPPTRWNMGMDYDPAANGLLLYGGFGASMFGDTWFFKRLS
jgi:hypothetical protein